MIRKHVLSYNPEIMDLCEKNQLAWLLGQEQK